MITLLLGLAASGKTGYIMNEIKKNAAAGIRSILIVPEQFSHDAERELCRLCGNSISLQAEVLSFTRLSSRVFAAAGGLSVKNLDPGGRVLVMNRALQSLSGTLRLYRLGKRRVDFLSRLLSAYDEITTSCTNWEQLRQAGEARGGTLGQKLLDLADLFEAYQALIPEGMADPAGRLTETAEKIGRSGVTKNGRIYLDCFTDFTQQQLAVIEQIAASGSDVTAALTCSGLEGEETAFLLPRITAGRLTEMAARLHLPCRIENRAETGARPAALAAAAHLVCDMTEDGEETPDTECIRIYREDSKSRECEAAAAEILRCAREKGWRWRDMAVSVRGFEDYAPAAESVFARYGIPVMLVKKEDIMQKPVMALAAGVLDVIAGGWDYSAVFRYLKTGVSLLSREETDRLENYALKWNIRGRSQWTRDADWRMHPAGYNMPFDEETEGQLAELNELRRRFAAPVAALEDRLKQATDAAEMVRALYAFLEETAVAEKLAEKADQLERQGRLQLADEYSQLWEILVSALEQCEAALQGVSADTEEFARLIRLTLSQYDVGSIPVSVDRVGLGDLTRMRKRGLKLLVIMGATAGRMPQVSEDSGVFTDEERDRLCDMGVRLADNTERRIARELGAAYGAVSAPSEELVLTYSPDSDGKLRPSYAVTRLEEKLGVPERTMGDEARTQAAEPCFELAVSAGKEAGGLAGAARRYFAARPEYARRLEEAGRRLAAGDEALPESAAAALYPGQIRLTASRVDKICACKYEYFLQYGLKLKKRKQALFDAPEIGTYMHYILENTVREAESRGGFRALSEQDCRAMADRYSRRYVAEKLDHFREQSGRFVFLMNRLARETEQVAADMARELARSDFRPLDFELDFSENGDMPPAQLGDIRVSGKVDRVDGWVHDGRLYLRVVDYKTGRKSFSLSDVWYGMGLQMLIYLFTLQRSGRQRYGREVVPAGVLYVPARDVLLHTERDITPEQLEAARISEVRRSGLLVGDAAVLAAMESGGENAYLPVKYGKDGAPEGESLVTLERLGKLEKHIEILLHRLGREIRSGEIRPEPYYRTPQDNACQYCDYKKICHTEDSACRVKKRYLKKLKNEEVWEKIQKETGS